MPNEYLTKYELSRIIGVRTAQLSMSAPSKIPSAKHRGNFTYAAALELKEGLLDIVIRRELPGQRFYEVNIRDLTLPSALDTLVTTYENM